MEESIIDKWEPIISKRFYEPPSSKTHADYRTKDPDIKPRNVVLTQSQNNYYPGYLTAKMIDFGNAMDENSLTDYDGKMNGIGTEGWGPPVSEHTVIIFSRVF